MAPHSKPAPDLASLVARYLRTLELGKKKYKQSDAQMDELHKLLKEGDEFDVSVGGKARRVRYVDKFEGRTKINVGMNARRYEFEEVVAP